MPATTLFKSCWNFGDAMPIQSSNYVHFIAPVRESNGTNEYNNRNILSNNDNAMMAMITSLDNIIWEEGRVAALSHMYAAKSSLVTTARPKFVPKSTPSRGPIPKPHYLPHAWTHPTYDAKRHPDPICRFSTMHWTS